MITRILFIFTVLLSVAYLGTWLHHEPGYVLIAFHHWVIESTFWVAIVAMLVFAYVAHFVLSILKVLLNWLRARRQQSPSGWLDAIDLLHADTPKQTPEQTPLQLLQNHLEQHQHTEFAQVMARLPKNLKQDPDIMALYARHLRDTQQDKTLETLVKKHPNSAALHLCLGQALMTKQLWGAAKTHLEKSINIQPSAETYYALGQLLDIIEEEEAANAAYRKGLESACAR